MNSKEATEAMHAVWREFQLLPYKERGAEIGWRHQKIETEWRAYLYEEHGLGLPEAVLSILFSKAWEDGHSCGYYEVENYFSELCSMQAEINKITQSLTKKSSKSNI